MLLTIEFAPRISDVAEDDWNALTDANDPFTEHAFLLALEDSGSVGQRTGWLPQHVLVKDEERLIGAAPTYIKTNSYGEYIFDWAWANAATRAGLSYYPKLTTAVPFTPATGRRLLVADSEAPEVAMAGIARGLEGLREASESSSVHLLFLTEPEQAFLAERAGYLARKTYQYHWLNRGGWGCFADYLGAFRASSRKAVRRERRGAASLGLDLVTVRGEDMTPKQWGALHRFYRSTVAEKGAYAYLAPQFFELLPERLAHRVVCSFAMRGDEPVAGALCFQRGDHLYGRYWGCDIDAEFLHFELCYYRPIEFALEHGITRFEAGAQGEHKIKRGLLPHTTYSAHRLMHPGLHEAIADFVEREADGHREDMAWLAERGPFRRDGGGSDGREKE